MKQLRALYQRVGYTVSSFVLALSMVTAAVPFILSESVGAAPVVVGTVHSNITSETELKNAIASGATEINLGASFTIDSQVSINRTLTLNGNGYTLSAKSGWVGSASNDSILAVTGGSPVISNVVVDGISASEVQGIQVWESAATLNNVTAINNQKAGIHVNGSTVTVSNVTTSNNSRGKTVLGISSFGGIVVTGGELTVTGLSTHTSEGNHIRRNGGSVVDSDSQYSSLSVFGITRYSLKSAPAAPVITAPAAVVEASSATASWSAPSATNTRNGADSYLVSLNGGPEVSVSGLTYELTGLSDGNYTLTVQSVAKSGLLGGVSTHSFSVAIPDTTAPNVHFQESINGKVVNGDVHTRSRVDNELGEVERWTYINGDLFKYEVKPVGTAGRNSEIKFNTYDYPEGVTVIRVVARDSAGNEAEVSQTFTIDNTNPTIAVNLNRSGYLSNGGVTGPVKNPEIEARDLNLDRFEIYKDGSLIASASANGATQRFAKINHLGEGTYVARAYDKAGLTSDDFEFTIDKTLPSTSITSATVSGDVLSFEGSVSDDNLNYYYCYLTTNQAIVVDGHAFTPGQEVKLNNNADSSRNGACNTTWAGGATEFTGVLGGFNITNVPDGEYTVRLVAHDLAGNNNASNPATFVITVDRTAPVITLNGGDVTLTVGDTYTDLGATADDASEVVVDDSLVDTSVAGVYTVTYTATDAAGNVGTATRTVTVVEPTSQIINDGSDATTDDDDDDDRRDALTVVTPLFQAGFIQNPDLTPDTEDAEDADQDVAGATTDNAAQVAGASDEASWLGLAWYWWVLIGAAVLGAGWWLVGAIRRRGADAEA